VLRLAMRNYNDQKLVQTAGADLNHLLSAYSPAAPPAPRKGKAAAVRPMPVPVTVEIMRDGKTMHPAAFVTQASVARAASEQVGQWAGVSDEAPSATAQPAKPAADQQNNKIAMARPGAAAEPQTSSPPASSSAAPSEASAAPERKTIDVDP
jgi:hypothetical protein